jgi:hypothetical protein
LRLPRWLSRLRNAIAGSRGATVAAAAAGSGDDDADDSFYDRAVAGTLVDPLRRSGLWSTLGDTGDRLGPWVLLLLIAFVVEGVARSALRDRLRVRGVRD